MTTPATILDLPVNGRLFVPKSFSVTQKYLSFFYSRELIQVATWTASDFLIISFLSFKQCPSTKLSDLFWITCQELVVWRSTNQITSIILVLPELEAHTSSVYKQTLILFY